jgi:ORF6N domain
MKTKASGQFAIILSMASSAEENANAQFVPAPTIEKRIFVIRERQVMLDEDLADLYGVETRVLVQQVRRNEKRFPADFMFQLSEEEFNSLKSQSVISSGGHGGRRKRPMVFTEQGVAMLSGVLRSDRAIAVNIEIMRAFVELRRVAGSFQELQQRLDQMELDIGARLSEHDEQLRHIFEALRQLIAPPPSTKRPIGFRIREGD